MRKQTRYHRTRFTESVLREAFSALRSLSTLPEGRSEYASNSVAVDGSDWTHKNDEEFFADFRRSSGEFMCNIDCGDHALVIAGFSSTCTVTITAPDRSGIEKLSGIFERARANCETAPPDEAAAQLERPVIFIGHGRNQAWRDLKDHLHEKHGHQISAYEIGARAGHAIRDILDEMLTKSSLALLVLTGEDDAGGAMRARQNVVHETGLFQGRLGFSRAIVLLEDGVEEFSNIHGIEQIRFAKGNIKETFGDVVATINREFPVVM